MLATLSPFPQYFDLDGSPLDGGALYFGTAGADPEVSPITVYWDEAGTQPVTQPVSTVSGYAVRSGTPAIVYASGAYSMSVRNRRGSLVFYAATSANSSNSLALQASIDAVAADVVDAAADLSNTSGAEKNAGQIGFNPALNYVGQTIGRALRSTLISVNLFANVDATGATDCSTAFWGAVATINALGGTALLRGRYKISAQRSVSGSLAMTGDPGSCQKDFGNEPVSRVKVSTEGAVIDWVGATTTPIIQFAPDAAERFSVRDIAFVGGDSYRGPFIKLTGAKWFLYNGASPQIDIDNVAFYRDSQAVTPGSSGAVGLYFDLTDATTPRCFFGARVRGVFAYGIEEVYHVETVNQATPLSGNWMNGCEIGYTHAYKCYRIANFIAGTTGDDQISMNEFGPWVTQPVGNNSGNMATGVLRLVNNVNRNTFRGVFIFDLAPIGTPRRVIHINPLTPTNPDTWNRYINCPDFEIDADFPMANIVDGDNCTGGQPIGRTGANFWLPEVKFGGSSTGVTYTVQLGRFVKQGRLIHVELDVTLNARGAASGASAVAVTLPVAKDGGPACPATVSLINASGTIYGVRGEIGADSGQVDVHYFATSGSTVSTELTKDDVATGTTIRISATYPART